MIELHREAWHVPPAKAVARVLALAAAIATPSSLCFGAAPQPAASGEVGGRVLSLTGDLMPMAQVKVFSRVAGQVLQVGFKEGMRFQKGAVLAEIDPIEYEFAVRSAEADLAIAQAKLTAMEAGGRPEERQKAAAEVAAAKAVFDAASQDFTRIEGLRAKGGQSQQQLDNARRELDVARARLNAAREALDLVKEGPRPEDKAIGRAEVARAKVRLEEAKLELGYTKVRAPFDGGIGQRLVDEGAYVLAANSPQAPALCVFAQGSVMKAMLDIPEKDLPYVRIGQTATLRLQAAPDETFKGVVVNVHPYVDPRTRLGKLEVHVPNEAFRLLTGMFVKAEVQAADRPARSAAEVLSGGPPRPVGSSSPSTGVRSAP